MPHLSSVSNRIRRRPASSFQGSQIGGGSSAPSGPAGGVLGGAYPDPDFAVDMATQAELNAAAATAASATATVATNLADHLADATDAHDASAVSVLDAGGHFTGTDVEAVLAELFTDIPSVASVAFRATKNGTDQASIPSATATKVTFTTETFDAGSHYDNTNSKWTPPAGCCSILASVYFTAGITAGFEYQVLVYKNGSIFAIGPQVSVGTSTVYCSVATLDNPNGSDYYEVFCYAPGAGTKTISGDKWTLFQGTMI